MALCAGRRGNFDTAATFFIAVGFQGRFVVWMPMLVTCVMQFLPSFSVLKRREERRGGELMEEVKNNNNDIKKINK